MKKIIGDLRIAAQQAIELKASLQGEVSGLKAEKAALADEIQKQKLEVADLQEKLKLVKLAKSLSNGEKGSYELKLKVNEMLREVDNCIALLNK